MTDDAPLAKQVHRGVAWAAGAQAVIAVADMVSQLLVVALWVSAPDLGIAYKAVAFYPMLDTAADLGVTSSLIQRDDHTPERVSTVFWVDMIVSGALFALLAALGPLYGIAQGHSVIGLLLIAYGGKLVFQNVYAIPFALLRKELASPTSRRRGSRRICPRASRASCSRTSGSRSGASRSRR